ncbi:methyltransferase domain-containing protein [Caulobacter sp.]|uniref:methyltransferase domain-containing protein n=1 Tax=Caulobacter sp. TaxID=78 RepID=UPI001616568D
MTASPLLFDRTLHRQRLDRAAPDYASADFLKARAAQDVVMRLETILRRFPVAVDLGSRNGSFSKALADSDAAANIDVLFETDLSARMLAGRPGLRVAADEERLPFGDDTLDLVVSTLALHWTNDLVGALIQVRRALRPDGLFIGAMFGGATLTELRQCLLAAEAEVSDGAAMRVSPFADASDAAALLQRAGFALPVADVDRVKVRYAHPIKLLQDLRAMGETSVLLDRSKKPLPRKVLFRALELYVERFAEADGRVPATFEIVAVTGWAPHDSQQKPLRPGSAKMRLADALGTTEQSAGDKAG